MYLNVVFRIIVRPEVFLVRILNWLQIIVSFVSKWDLLTHKLKTSRQFVQLVTNHNKVCVYKSTFKIFISIYIHQ